MLIKIIKEKVELKSNLVAENKFIFLIYSYLLRLDFFLRKFHF